MQLCAAVGNLVGVQSRKQPLSWSALHACEGGKLPLQVVAEVATVASKNWKDLQHLKDQMTFKSMGPLPLYYRSLYGI